MFMKINELLEGYRDINDVIKAYKNQFQDEIDLGCRRDGCGIPATGFEQFAADNGFGMVERVQGFFTVDKPDPENLKPGEDINDPEVQEKSKVIPHQWNEYKDQIIDLTGYAQFVETGLASDLNSERYSYQNRQ